MGIEDDPHLVLASLGRPFQLGMLYDCRSDSLIPGITLWDLEKLRDNRDVRPQANTQFQIISSDSIEDKSSALNVSGDMKVSLLGGMIDVQGSGKYMNDTKKSQQQARVTLHYSTTNRFEQLTMSHLWQQNMPHSHVFDQGTATHVVTAILFGAQAFFVFDREVSSSESLTDVQGEMEAKISFIPKIGLEGKVSLEASEEEKASDQQFSCTFYGDYSLPSNPTTFQDAIVIYTSLPQLLGENGNRTVPMKVWLYPLNKLDSSAARLVRGISVNLISRSQALLETLNEVDMKCSDMLKELATFPFPMIQQKVKRFRAKCMEHRQGFQKSLARVLPSIRGGREEEGILADILINKEQSPLGSKSMTEWLDNKQQEICVVRGCLTQMKEVKLVTQAEIGAELLDLKTQYVICFVFTSLDEEDIYLAEIKKYLQAERTGKAHQDTPVGPGHEPWFCSSHSMWECARSFLDIYTANRADKSKKFIVSSVPDKEHSGASIYLYERGRLVSRCLNPPGKPLSPTVFGRSHDSVSLHLQPTAPGSCQNVSYRVEYHTTPQETWDTLTTTEISDPFNITGLSTYKEYQFRYIAVSKVWDSLPSDTVSVITLPTSAPGKLLVAHVKDFDVKVTWEKPSVLGDGVTIDHYKIQYQENRNISIAECNLWQEHRTIKTECLYMLTRLQFNKSYTIRVSAVCGKAGESAPSLEASITISNKPKRIASNPTESIPRRHVSNLTKKAAHSEASIKTSVTPNSKASKQIKNVPKLQASKPAQCTPKSQTSKPAHNIPKPQASKPTQSTPKSEVSKPAQNIRKSQTSKPTKSTPKLQASKQAQNIRQSQASKQTQSTPMSQASKQPESTTKSKASKKTPMSLTRSLLNKSALLTKGCPSVYQLPVESDKYNTNEELLKKTFGNESLTHNSKTIMFLGATGSGKTTLINAIINYIIGVEWEDEFRYKLINEKTNTSQAESQTSSITAYELNYQNGFRIPHSLIIIDTPGFGDTKGITRDKYITDKIRDFFTSPYGVDQIDAICFVVQSALARLTPTQKYIFDSILSIFGKDIAENIRVLLTFADGQLPPVLDAINESGIPCPKDNEGRPLHFKFNNSAIFAQTERPGSCGSDEENFDKMFWKMGFSSMKKFFAALGTMESKSLRLTKEVLTERQNLDANVQGLQPQINVGLSKLEEIRKTKQVLHQHEDEIKANQNFEYEITETIAVKEEISGIGTFITNCQQCHFTCHHPCYIADDNDKYYCAAMNRTSGYCTVCPGKCIWNIHYNQKYKFSYITQTKKGTYEELKSKYEKASGEKMTQEKLMQKLEDELNLIQGKVLKLVETLSRCLARLKEIALRPNPLSTPEYIELLIEAEKREAKPGYKERIQSLNEVKNQADLLAKVANNQALLPHEIEKQNHQQELKKGTEKKKGNWFSWLYTGGAEKRLVSGAGEQTSSTSSNAHSLDK